MSFKVLQTVPRPACFLVPSSWGVSQHDGILEAANRGIISMLPVDCIILAGGTPKQTPHIVLDKPEQMDTVRGPR